MSDTFAAVVPVIDERETVGGVITELRSVGACCVFVVDGASTDGTPAVAAAAGAIVVSEPRRGYGRACRTGAEHASRGSSGGHDRHSMIAFVDGDGSCAGDDIRRLVDALADVDVALGVRPSDRIEPGAMPWHARLGNAAVAGLVSIRTGRRVHDLPPAKAIRADALERLDLDADGFGWTVQFVTRALVAAGLRTREVPVAFRIRQGGRSKVSGSLRASVRAGIAMIRAAIVDTRPRPVITLMAKAPGPGQAKSRLAADLGDEATAALWRAMLADTAVGLRAVASAHGAVLHVMVPRRVDREPVTGLIGRAWAPLVQRGPGLSAALVEAFLEAFDRGAERAIAIAGDAPFMPQRDVTEAMGRLSAERAVAVIGPSRDGGYHLIGLRWDGAARWWPRAIRRRRRMALRRRLEAVFGATLGGADALRSTSVRLRTAGWSVSYLERRGDIDTVADLVDASGISEATVDAAPRTTAWLAANASLVAARSAPRRLDGPGGPAGSIRVHSPRNA